MTRWCAVLIAVVSSTASLASAQNATEVQKKLEALEAEVARLAADAPAAASAVTDLSARINRLEQELAGLERERTAVPDLVGRVDALELQLADVAADLEQIRTKVADLRQPTEAASGAGGVTYGDGFRWRSGDGSYGLRIGGYMQFRADTTVAEDASGDLETAQNTFALRRTRFFATGDAAFGEFFLLFDPRLDTALLDYWVRVPLALRGGLGLAIKAGQDRNAFTRNFMVWAPDTIFLERPQAVQAFRYDRSPGLGLELRWRDRLYAYVGAVNGSGPGQVDDNFDAAAIARVDAAILGRMPERRHFGDLSRSPTPQLLVGAGFVHELAAVPTRISGIEVGNRDVDGDGDLDDVRVISASADAQFRWMGFELTVEGMFRRENWGTVFDHPDNIEVGELFEFDGERNYLGFYGDASYFILDHLLVGGRVGHHRQTAFLLDGRQRDQPPTSKRQLELAATAQMFIGPRRFGGIQYQYLNDNNGDEPEVPNDEQHRVIVELQFVW